MHLQNQMRLNNIHLQRSPRNIAWILTRST